MWRIEEHGRFAAIAMMLVAAAQTAAAQTGTDILLAPFSERNGSVVIGSPVNATARAGYDNQPFFLDGGGAFFYVSGDSGGATDVFRYEVAPARSVRLTDTPESEYSPTPMPGGASFSAVRVEEGGAQRLWRFDLDGDNPRLVAAGVDSVGYHCWRDEHTVVVFIVGDPHALRVVDTVTGNETTVALDVGRTLHRIPGGDEVSFLARDGEAWRVLRLDADTGRASPLSRALEGSQDCAWTPRGRLLMARGNEVFVLASRERSAWERVAAFDSPARGITRLAVDPTGRWIALVADEPAE